MKKKTLSLVTILAISGAVVLTGCGGGGGGSSTIASNSDSVGYFVDSAVVGADYDCLSDEEFNKTTGAGGKFECETMAQIRFRIGKLELGTIDYLPDDNYVLPQDLAGVSRNDLNNSKVLALAKLLQSLDVDGDPSNGITIPEDVKEHLAHPEDGQEHEKFDDKKLHDYLLNASVPEDAVPDDNKTLNHLRNSMDNLKNKGKKDEEHGENTNSNGKGDRGTKGEEGSRANGHGEESENGYVDLGDTLYNLSQELKDAVAYMGNEERLAYDVYSNLYAKYENTPDKSKVYSLYNISTKSESKHVSTVQAIVKKYSLTTEDLSNVSEGVANSSVELTAMPSGKYDIPAIQSLYDALYEKGTKSPKDALEVGCMVEVTDINDLNEKIEIATADGAKDIEKAFTKLRDASYNHYWAFDRALKNMGVEDGCCALGTIDGVEYCHEEYPQKSGGDDKEKGSKSGEGHGNGSGNGSGNGKGNAQG
jgi:hypothetical protein